MSPQEPAPGYPQPVAPAELGYVPEGYRPPPGPKPARRLLWLWLTLGVVLIALVAAGTTAVILARRWDGRPVKGDVAITVRLLGPDGGPPTAAALDRTKRILTARMNQLELVRPTVTAIGAETLLVTAGRGDAERIKALLVPGNLTFRRVLASTSGEPGSGCRPDPQERTDRAAALASAKAKLGPVFDAAAAVRDPSTPGQAALTGFNTLTCTEIAALPHTMQYAVPAVTCAMLNERPPGTLDDSGQAAAATATATRSTCSTSPGWSAPTWPARREIWTRGPGSSTCASRSRANRNGPRSPPRS